MAVTGKAAIRASASVGKPTVSGARASVGKSTATASSGPNKPAPATSSAGAGKAGGPGGRWASVVRGTPASTPPAVVTTEPSAFPALGAGSGVTHAVPQAPAPVESAAKSAPSAAAPAPAHAPAPTPAPAPVSAATAPSSLLPAPSSTAVAEASTPSPLLLPPALPAPALTPDMRVVVDSELEAVMSDPSDATLALILNRCMFGDAKALASVRHVHSTLGFTLLIAAARLGSVSSVRRVLGMGGNAVLNAKDGTGLSALGAACAKGSVDCARLLVSVGAGTDSESLGTLGSPLAESTFRQVVSGTSP